MITVAAFVSVLSLGAQDPVLSAQDVDILWKGRDHPVAELEGTLIGDAYEDALGWARWARINGYTAALDDSARVLVLQPQGRRPKPRSRGGPAPLQRRSGSDKTRLAQKLEHLDYVLSQADRLFPMPVDASAAVASAPGGGNSEGSEGPWEEWEQFGERISSGSEGEGEGYVWTEWQSGNSGAAPREHLPTLIELRDVVDQKTLLADLQREHPYIARWAAGASKYSGFVLSQPLVGAWLVSGDGLEEWSPKHELVNRATRLLLLRRHGLMPEWLSLGLGWQFEFNRFRTVYCYPRRDEFVFATEHSDWDKTLRQLFKKRDTDLRMREILVERNAKYRANDATRSWGVAEFLVRRHPDDLAGLLEAFSADRMQNDRTTNADGTWELIPDYEAPGDLQAELLRSHLGQDVFEELLEFMRAGAK